MGQIFGKNWHQGVLHERVESGKDPGRREYQESTAEAERGTAQGGPGSSLLYRDVKKREKTVLLVI